MEQANTSTGTAGTSGPIETAAPPRLRIHQGWIPKHRYEILGIIAIPVLLTIYSSLPSWISVYYAYEQAHPAPTSGAVSQSAQIAGTGMTVSPSMMPASSTPPASPASPSASGPAAAEVTSPVAPPKVPMPSSLNALKQEISAMPAEERYLELKSGIARLPPDTLLDTDDAIMLMAGIRETQFRFDLIKNTFTPRLRIPVDADGTVHMLSGLAPFERAELLDPLARCIERPITDEQISNLIFNALPSRRMELDQSLRKPLDCTLKSATK